MSLSDFERRLSTKTPVLSLEGQTLDLHRLRLLRSYLCDNENNETFFVSGVGLLDERYSAPDRLGLVKSDTELAEWNSLMKEIKSKLDANCSRFPNDFIHCLLSYHVYYDYIDSKEETSSRDIVDVMFHKHHEKRFNDLLVDWKRAEIIDEKNNKRIATRMNTRTDYLGVIYQNKKTKQLVLTHCGTNARRLGTIEADFYGVILGNPIQEQTLDCYEMTKLAVEFCRKNEGYNLSITGHSLGAWLAELSIYFCHFDFEFKNVKVVNFESPGSFEQIENLMPNVFNRYSLFDEKSLNIVSYLSRPNYVNTFNKHVGLVFELDAKINPAHYMKWEKALMKLNRKLPSTITIIDSILTLRSHMLEYLLDEFDPLTGRPKQVKKVYDWPCVKLNVIDTKLNSLINNNNHRYLKSKVIRMISPTFKRVYDLFKMVGSWITGSLDLDHHQLFKQLEYSKKAIVNPEKYKISEFKMSYKAHYSTEVAIDLSKDTLLHQDIGSPDYYLFLIYKTDSNRLTRSCRFLTEIKSLYKLRIENGKTYTIQSVPGITVEYLRELIHRMLVYDPRMESTLSEEGSGAENPANTKSIIIDNLGSVDEIHFTGKVRTLDKIDAFLASNESSFPNLLIISSMAGCGKSTLAVEYAKRMKRSNPTQTVVWFESSSSESIVQKLNEILSIDLGMGKEFVNELREDRIKLKLIVQNIKANFAFKHLFIFDNIGADQMILIKELLLMAPDNLRIILTTRDDSLSTCHGLKLNRLLLKPFTRNETIAYLTKRLGNKVSAHNMNLLLNKYLLAPDQSEFLPLRISNLARCLEYFFQIGQPDVSAFETIGKVSARFSSQLTTRYLFECFLDETRQKDSYGLLKHLAFLDYKSISLLLVKKVFIVKQKDVVVLDQSIRELENFSYVQKFYESGSPKYKLPTVLQQEIISYLKHANEPTDDLTLPDDHENQTSNLKVALKAIVVFLCKRLNQVLLEEVNLAAEINSHAVALSQTSQKFEIRHPGLNKLNENLSSRIQTSKLESRPTLKTFESQLEEKEHVVRIVIPTPVPRRRSRAKSETKPDKDLSVSYFNTGNECYFRQDYRKAIEYHEKALEMARNESQTSPLVASLLTNLGNSYNALGDYNRAIDLHKRAINLKSLNSSVENSLDLAKAHNNLGAAQYLNMMFDDALVSYTKSAEMMLNLNNYGELDAELASSYSNMALVYQSKKDFAASIEFFEAALQLGHRADKDIDQSKLDHVTLHKNLGISYHSIKNYPKAIDNYRTCLELLKKRPKHSNHLDSNLQLTVEKLLFKATRLESKF